MPFGSSFPVELPSWSSVMKYRCAPPLGVLTVSVTGHSQDGSYSVHRSVNAASPSSSLQSRSMTTRFRPACLPVSSVPPQTP
jgi:hypothetical protein